MTNPERPVPRPPARPAPAIPRMDEDDWALSMRTSRRARDDANNAGLRSLLVHRLSVTMKGIARRALRRGQVSLYCEPCNRWASLDGFPAVTQCESCSTVYRLEFAVYEEVQREDLA